MKQISEQPTSVAWIAGKHEYPQDSLTIVVKAAFKVSPNSKAELIPEISQVMGDQYLDNDRRKMQSYESDLAIFKPNADVFVMGTCHTPDGKPRTTCAVEFSVGSVSKSALVNGPRTEVAGLVAGTTTSSPLEFTSTKITTPPAEPNYLPEFETPATAGQQKIIAPIENVEDGFGPIHKTHSSRTGFLGTYDDKWKQERWPWFPDDFDYQYFNAAPEDLQTDYLKGDETFTAVNMHPEFSQYSCELPGVVARCFVNEAETEMADDANLKEVELNLDTFWLDMDSETLILVWRGVTPVQSQKYIELKHVYTAIDQLDAPLSTEDHTEKFIELAFPVEVDASIEEEPEEEEEVVEEQVATAVEAGADPVQDTLDQAMEQCRTEMKNMGMDDQSIDQILNSDDPAATFQQMSGGELMPESQANAIMDANKEKAAQALLDGGLSPDDVKFLMGS